MSTKPPSRVVFVGNIPYGLSEEQITDIFSTAGKVLNFRLVYDRETGRPKGFGFAEYPDADSAASAVRNLNDYEVMNRKLRVDYSTEGRVDQDDDKSGPSNSANTGSYGQHSNGVANAAPHELPRCHLANSTHPPPPQLLDILKQMKSLASTDPARATELLDQAPQLSYAIFQALLLMGLVSPETIHSVVDQNAPPPVQAPPAGYPPSVMGGFPGVATSTPPVGAPFAPPVAAPQPSYAPAPAASGLPPTQDPEQLMKMVLELPQATIDQLPEAERQTIMGLRAQFMPQR
ncbi:hypothetical protein PG990_006706 [Apiospora arundinis]